MRIITVTTAAAVTYDCDGVNSTKLPIPTSIAVNPGAGGTLLVEYQLVDGGLWSNWPAGAAATRTIYVLTGPVYALRFTAAVNDGTVEITE